MADNVTFQSVPATPPIGAVVAADDVGGVLYQRVKMDVGADGLSVPLSDLVTAGVVTGVKGLRVFVGPGDPISDLPVWIDLEQHQVHEGETFHAQDVRLGLTLTPVKYALVVPTFSPTIRAPHLVIATSVYNNAVRVDLYEGSTYTGGTPLTAYNRNRNSANTPQMSITSGVTSSNGTLLDSWFAGSGEKAAGENRSSSEWVLKANTTYRVDLTAQTNPTDCIIQFGWYEDLGV